MGFVEKLKAMWSDGAIENDFNEDCQYSIDTWVSMVGECPNCNSKDIEYNSTMVLTSYPPQHSCRCKSCGKYFYSGQLQFLKPHSSFEFPNFSPWGSNTGWLCPKCGRVMAPHIDYCKFCNDNNTTISTLSTNTNTTTSPLVNNKTTAQFSGIDSNTIKLSNENTATTITNNLSTATMEQNKDNSLKHSTNIDEAMKHKFLDESESVFEAVSKYIAWERSNNSSNVTATQEKEIKSEVAPIVESQSSPNIDLTSLTDDVTTTDIMMDVPTVEDTLTTESIIENQKMHIDLQVPPVQKTTTTRVVGKRVKNVVDTF